VHKLSAIGLLWISCLLASLGLVALSVANSPVTGVLAATLWGTGVCFMWPTMLATASERFPHGGALLMGLMGTAGTLSINFVLPAMGGSRLEEAPRGALAAGMTAITRAITRRLEADIARYGGTVELTVLPAPSLPGLLPTDFGHADELIEQGLRRARAELRRHQAPAPSLRRAA